MNALMIYTVFGVALAMVFVAGLVVLGGMKTRGRMRRALNMTLFLVRIPRVAISKDGPQKNEKELMALGEQMIAGFSNLHSKGWNKFLYGEPYVAMEMAVHHIGEETNFYLAVPKTNEENIRKQLY